MRLTLCGSAKFEDLFHKLNEELTLAGHVVYGLAVYPSYHQGNKDWYTKDQKETLDAVHFCKIDNSDGIVVINPDNYIGASTSREIKHAQSMGKKIFYYCGGVNYHSLIRDFSKTNEVRIGEENRLAASSEL